jgi:hypothetical protein
MPGQIHVEMYRPERRFGWAAVVWMDDPFEGKRKVLQIGSDGEHIWDIVERDVAVGPTYFFDDEILAQIVASWPDKPAPDPGALNRERTHADRLFTLTETLVDRVVHGD